MSASSAAVAAEPFDTGENFAELFERYVSTSEKKEGAVVKGFIVAIENDDIVVVDVGLKSEGRIPLKEFAQGGQVPELKVGDEVEVYLERFENKNGEVTLSREKALREEAWGRLETACEKQTQITGVIFGRVKGGFTVDIDGAVAFLPGSQVDIRPIKDVGPLMGMPQPFMILKMDRRRGNIVVSRRAVLEESRAGQRNELLGKIAEGQVLDGIVKNITDYGAFIDMGGIDGLLHVTDISWKRVNHPSEVFTIGQPVKVMVTRYDAATKRISLGMKQLEKNPWEGLDLKYPVGAKLKGRITNITDYGAFVELEPGIEGLVHVSEMSWTKKNTHPSKIVSTSQEVDVVVLDIDPVKHRISLGMKQCEENPWQKFVDSHAVGTIIEGEIKNITDFGLFVGLEGDIDGLVHHSDLSWTEPGDAAIKTFKKGDTVKAKVLATDVERERISLGIKQLTEAPEGALTAAAASASAPAAESGSKFKKGDTVTVTVSAIENGGIEVKLDGDIKAFIKKADLARDRQEQRPDKFAVGDRIDAKVTGATGGRVNLSVKQLEVDQHKQAIAEYGSTDSGASLGDILGAALAEGAKKGKGKKKAAAEEDSDAE